MRILLLFLAMLPLHLFATPVELRIPIEAFYRRPEKPVLFFAKFWPPKKSGNSSTLVVSTAEKKESDVAFISRLAKQANENGEGFLWIKLRPKTKWSSKTFLEDVQTAVVFLKTDKRAMALSVKVVGISEGAEAAMAYASATPQMYKIVPALALVVQSGPHQAAHWNERISQLSQGSGMRLLIASSKKLEECKDSCKNLEFSGKKVEVLYHPLKEFLWNQGNQTQGQNHG